MAEIAATVAYAGVVASLIAMALEARLRGVLLDKLLDALAAWPTGPTPRTDEPPDRDDPDLDLASVTLAS